MGWAARLIGVGFLKIDKMKAIVDGVDFFAKTMEKKWGVSRLRLLVDADLREKFDTQARLFNEALSDPEVGPIQAHADAMMRGWRALDDAARASGAEPLKPSVWEVRLPSGKVCALVRTNDEAHHVATEGRYVQVWTLDEVGRLIDGPLRTVGKAKEVFPGALVSDVNAKVDFDDDIPF